MKKHVSQQNNYYFYFFNKMMSLQDVTSFFVKILKNIFTFPIDISYLVFFIVDR
jgi:hypothetical protein